MKLVKERVYFLLPLILFFGIAFFLWRGLSLDPRKLPSVLINKSVPSFSLPRLEDPAQFFSNRELIGQVSLVNVWATWCINCRLEHPILMDIARTQNIKIYGLNYKDSRDDALEWLKQYGNPYAEIGFDQDGTTSINWGVYGTPETFVIDSEGRIRFKHIGPVTEDIWQKELQPEIQEIQSESKQE